MFQSTGLIRGPTYWRYTKAGLKMVSIHRPHTRPDNNIYIPLFVQRRFNPQASYEARLYTTYRWIIFVEVSIHRPHTRPDDNFRRRRTVFFCFNPQASYEARQPNNKISRCTQRSFNPQASYEARLIMPPPGISSCRFQSTGLIRGPTRGFSLSTSNSSLFQSTGLIRGPT